MNVTGVRVVNKMRIAKVGVPGPEGTADLSDVYSKDEVDSIVGNYVPISQKGAASGVAELDGDGHVPMAQLPAAILGAVNYQGTWDAAANTPAIPAAAAGNKGHFYRVSADGATNIDGITDWKVGDWIISNGAQWQKVDNTDEVTEAELATVASNLTTEQTARIAGDAAIRELVDSLMPVYDLDSMPAAYTGPNTWDAKLQWCINRLTLSDDGLEAVKRSVTILFGDREYDISAAAFQQTGTLGTYVHGTLYGACAQLLIPATGPLANNRPLRLTLKAKKGSVLSYSVVNGDGAHVHELHTNAVIKSAAMPPAGEAGNYCMLGADRSLDAYANTHITCVTLQLDGVSFRTTTGLTMVDGSHLFSLEAEHYIFDTGVTADQLHLHDPRRDTAGNSYTTGETEIEYRKRQFGLKTPMAWNGASMVLRKVEGMGTRYGMDLNEHVVVLNVFMNYCYAAVGLRGMSHTAQILHSSLQRCPIWYEAPPAGDWNGNATSANVKIHLCSGEAYHPGEYGNPAGARWYNHVARIYDPNGLIIGEIVYRENPGELDPTWPTLPSGHGANLYLHELGVDPADSFTAVDTTPDIVNTELASGTATIQLDPAKLRHDTRSKWTANGLLTWDDATLAFGMWGEAEIVGTLASGTVTLGFTAPGTWELVWIGGAPTPAALDHDDVRLVRWKAKQVYNKKFLECQYFDLGNIAGTVDVPGGLGTPTTDEQFGGNYLYNGVIGSPADTINSLENVWIGVHPSIVVSRNGSGYALNEGGGVAGGTGYDAEDAASPVGIDVDCAAGSIHAVVCNHNGGTAWNTTTYWKAEVDQAAGTVKLFELATPEVFTQRGSTYNVPGGITAGSTHTLVIRPDGDTISVDFDGASVISYTVANRPGKANTIAMFITPAGVAGISRFRIYPS